MEVRIVMLINLLAWSFIVSQSFTYIIALDNVQRCMDAASWIELRKLLDRNYRLKFRFVFYTVLVTSPLLTLLCCMDPGSILFITSAIALVAIIADTVLMLKGNMPVNNLINTWGRDNYPENWQRYRSRWLYIFQWRQVANITGFGSLLAGAVLGL